MCFLLRVCVCFSEAGSVGHKGQEEKRLGQFVFVFILIILTFKHRKLIQRPDFHIMKCMNMK